jgi:hypothetical protein
MHQHNYHGASGREKDIERKTRRQKIKVIESMNPAWRDLSLEWEEPTQTPGFLRAAAARGNDRDGACRSN